MKVKAVIMKPDRTNDYVVVRRKDIEGKTFRHDSSTYFLHPDRFQVTWVKTLGLVKRYYSTFYYVQGMSQPLPAPYFQQIIGDRPILDETGAPMIGDDGKPQMMKDFVGVMDNGIKGEELAAIFNPWFYRIIAAPVKDLADQIQFYMSIGTLCGVAYLIYRFHNPV